MSEYSFPLKPKPDAKRVLEVQTLARQSWLKLMAVLDVTQCNALENMNYTPIHNHGVSLVKASDRKR